jgi:antirestriction protein ArdC
VNPVPRPTGRTPAGYDRDQAEAARQATLETMHAQLAEKVGSLDSLQAWGSWLRFANSFHRYSFNNTLLIWAQKPDATMVAGYRAWQARGRQVRRGETSIKVYGPVTTREPKTDPTGHPIRDADGKPVHEVRIVGVKPVSVFDVSQTEGEPLPTPPQASLLTGQAPDGLWDALQSFVEAQGYTVTRGDCGDANGFTVYDTRQVRVREDVDDAQAVKTLAHEAGHVLLHHPEQREKFSCRGITEVEAESVAYMVTAAHGLDASQYTFNYVAGWAHNAATLDGPSVEDIVKATGARVIGATDRILQATQPTPTLVDEALADLRAEVTIPFDHVTAADRPPGVHVPGAVRGERVDAAAPDGAARARQALPRQGVAAYSVSR